MQNGGVPMNFLSGCLEKNTFFLKQINTKKYKKIQKNTKKYKKIKTVFTILVRIFTVS